MKENYLAKQHGTFNWNELMTTDMEAAKDFYSKVIGWTPRDVQLGNFSESAKPGEPSYTLWTIGDLQVGGALKLEGAGMENIPPHWMSFVGVDDVDNVIEKVLAHGGKVLAGPVDVEDVGRFYVIADPQGAILGLGSSNLH